jgi:hypothetical protein
MYNHAFLNQTGLFVRLSRSAPFAILDEFFSVGFDEGFFHSDYEHVSNVVRKRFNSRKGGTHEYLGG